MTQDSEHDYTEWLNRRRNVQSDQNMVDGIMRAVTEQMAASPVPAAVPVSSPRLRHIAPALLWTAASLIFVARIASMIGNLVFPTSSFPEFADDHQIKESTDESSSSSRS